MERLRGTAAPSGQGPPTGGRGVLPRRRSVPMERLWGDGSPQRSGPTSWGNEESCPGGGRCLNSGTLATHCLTLQRTASLPGAWVELLSCTATLPGGGGQWNSCNALPHCLGAVGSGAVLCCAVVCETVRCGAVRCGAVLCVVLQCAVLCCAVRKCSCSLSNFPVQWPSELTLTHMQVISMIRHGTQLVLQHLVKQFPTVPPECFFSSLRWRAADQSPTTDTKVKTSPLYPSLLPIAEAK